ncbi:MAG TPA: hypothetical protein VGF36_06580 [Rhodopila sp.]
MSDLRLPPLRPYHPATFLERGVAVPFTTPLLAGTRARPAEKRGLELVIPNPSGGRGVYILAWSSITALCSPTLHDRQLNERIATLTHVTPSVIRQIGRELAAEGLAGEEAMDAAGKSTKQDKGDRLVANYLLLLALMAQVNETPAKEGIGSPLDPEEMQRRARISVSKIAPRLGRSTNWIASALESISDTLAGVGIDVTSTSSRLSRLVDLLSRCTREIADWSSTQQSDDQAAYAEMICAVADFTLALAETTLLQARGLTADVVGLLRTWANDPEPVVRIAGRSEWLLDGWEQICLLWRFAKDDAERRAALVEIAQLIPVLPREVREWTDLFLEADISLRLRRMIPLNEDWRTGATVFDLIARNERLRAATC